jgi:hypothetical protein
MNLGKRTAEIVHPTFPDFKITVKRPGRIQSMRLQRESTPEIVSKDEAAAIERMLTSIIEGWSGLVDEGEEIRFTPESLRTYLIDDVRLDVKKIPWDVVVADEGQASDIKPEDIKTHKENRVSDVPLWLYLVTIASKPETWSSDPLESGSSQQPTAA